MIRRIAALAAATLMIVTGSATLSVANTYESHECFSKDLGRRIDACAKLLAQPDLSPTTRSTAHAMRALALSMIGRYPEAIADYDEAIALNPYYAIALNNRAWAHFRSGNIEAAWPDVRRSLRIDPFSPHAHDTRAHLYHAEGKAEQAYADYQR
ncbi:MAG: tetratricopeptide repeat protein, partial [Pseudomonadota bacterium]